MTGKTEKTTHDLRNFNSSSAFCFVFGHHVIWFFSVVAYSIFQYFLKQVCAAVRTFLKLTTKVKETDDEEGHRATAYVAPLAPPSVQQVQQLLSWCNWKLLHSFRCAHAQCQKCRYESTIIDAYGDVELSFAFISC